MSAHKFNDIHVRGRAPADELTPLEREAAQAFATLLERVANGMATALTVADLNAAMAIIDEIDFTIIGDASVFSNGDAPPA